jgi:hypothetical protein
MNYSEAKDFPAEVEEKARETLTNLLELDRMTRGAPFAETRAARIAGIKDILLRMEKQARAKSDSETLGEISWVALTYVRLGSRFRYLTFVLTTIPPDSPWEETASARLATPQREPLTVPYDFFREVLSTLEREVADGVYDNNLGDDARSLVISRFKQAIQARADGLT